MILPLRQARAQEWNVYKIIVRQGDRKGLIVGRFEITAQDRMRARGAAERWCMDRGMEPDFNAWVTVMRKYEHDEPVTILVAN